MNAVAMFLQQMQIPAKQGETGKLPEDGEKNHLFHSLLAGSLTTNVSNEEQRQGEEENNERTMPLLNPVNIIAHLIIADEEMIRMTDSDQKIDTSNTTEILEEMEQSDLREIYQTLAHIFSEVQAVLAQLHKESVNEEKASPKLLQLLQAWVKAANNTTDQKGMEKALTSLRQDEAKDFNIWKDLLQTFEKRQQLASKQQYSANAQVTTEDIAKWLDRAMEKIQTPEKAIFQRMYTPSALPMSRMEQYAVYVNPEQSLKAQGQQLTDQFQTIIKSSNFMKMANNGNALILSLRPENLGEMMVRFTQVNGEMTVKILVATQAAKEMLETNMHQLRSMFSPQQVVVEKQDTLLQQGQETEKSMKDDEMDEQKHQQSNNSSEEDKQQPDNDFATQFEALLMNEEV